MSNAAELDMSNSDDTTATPAVDWESRSISSLTTVLVSNKVTPTSMADYVPHEPHEKDVDSMTASNVPSSTTPRQPFDPINNCAETGVSSFSTEEIELDSDLEQERAELAAAIAELREKQRSRNRKKRARCTASQKDHPDDSLSPGPSYP